LSVYTGNDRRRVNEGGGARRGEASNKDEDNAERGKRATDKETSSDGSNSRNLSQPSSITQRHTAQTVQTEPYRLTKEPLRSSTWGQKVKWEWKRRDGSVRTTWGNGERIGGGGSESERATVGMGSTAATAMTVGSKELWNPLNFSDSASRVQLSPLLAAALRRQREGTSARGGGGGSRSAAAGGGAARAREELSKSVEKLVGDCGVSIIIASILEAALAESEMTGIDERDRRPGGRGEREGRGGRGGKGEGRGVS
jgi:hypothetical protein